MMTPATKFLDSQKIKYQQYEYECTAHHDFGHICATELGRPQDEVFKTLLIHHDKTYITAVIPVNCTLNLKNAAKLAGVKNAEMVKPEDAERLTGFVCGGISPFGQKKRTITIVADTALNLKEMLVSGGRRGFSVGVNPTDLIKALGAKTGAITDPEQCQFLNCSSKALILMTVPTSPINTQNQHLEFNINDPTKRAQDLMQELELSFYSFKYGYHDELSS